MTSTLRDGPPAEAAAAIRPPHRFAVGTFQCTVLDDGTYEYEASRFVANGEPAEVARAFADHGILSGRILSPYSCLLIDTGSRLVLIDTGGASWDRSVGRLGDSLAAAGTRPDDVDIVVVTHGHPDHIGGNTDERGAPVFRRATHVMDAAEWRFWTSQSTLARVPERFREIARKNLPPLVDRLRVTHGAEEVVPGIGLLPSPGHTPGHLAVVVAVRGEELLYISDAALHPVHLEHPAWYPVYDLDPAQAVASRRMLLERAARLGCLVHAYHFAPYPCLGHVSPDGGGWRWEPIAGPA